MYNKQSAINSLIEENISLKNKLKLYIEKEKLYKSSITKIKKYQKESQLTFIKVLKDCKAHEEKTKITYMKYQKLLEKHYKENENRFIEENNSLHMELKQKNNIITILTKKINNLNEKLDKAEVTFRFKNKILEDEVSSQNMKFFNQLNESMIQLAKDTNDEIKLLRDEFNLHKKGNKSNKNFRKTEGNNDKKYNSNLFSSFDKDNSGNANNKNITFYKTIYNKEDINYLINRLILLENQNKNLNLKLKRKEEELSICNNLKNELLIDNRSKYFSSFDKKNYTKDNLKFKKLEKILYNFGDKINDLKTQFDESLIRHQNEIQEIKNNYENNNSQLNVDKGVNENNNYYIYDENINKKNFFNDEYFNNYDINELQITNNKNKSKNYIQLQNDKNVNSDDEIKDNYINSRLPKINTLD